MSAQISPAVCSPAPPTALAISGAVARPVTTPCTSMMVFAARPECTCAVKVPPVELPGFKTVESGQVKRPLVLIEHDPPNPPASPVSLVVSTLTEKLYELSGALPVLVMVTA